jgi:hypothetical protein
MQAAARRIVLPARSWGPKKWPVDFRIAPETGVPTSSPRADIAKLMPIRVPITLKCGLKPTSAVGGSETTLGEKSIQYGKDDETGVD